MKSYLDLVRVSEQVRRRQNRLTRLCIVLAVFLVTAIFGMADMELNSQRAQAIAQYGNWHARFAGLTQAEAALVAARPEVEASAWYGAVNTDLEADYTIAGQRVAICGCDDTWLEMFPAASCLAGSYPSEPGSVMVTSNAQTLLGAELGGPLTLRFPDGSETTLRVSGFLGDTSAMLRADAAGLLFNSTDYRTYFGTTENPGLLFSVRYTPFCSYQRATREIQQQFGLADESVGTNPKLLALSGQSDAPFMRMLYSAAAVLSALVTVSGVLMMTGSLNSSIAQRTEFFGLLRCLGATPKQVRKFVRHEALSWCRTAVPAGLLAGTAVVWALCEILRASAPGFFGALPRFGLSPIALASGALIGVLTVLLAARSPAKRAARVSPLAAASGNAGTVQAARKAADTRIFRIETALGVHHAVGSRRNFLLMAGSFAFSIILFLAFSTTVDFMGHAVKAVRPSTPDFSIISPEEACEIPVSLAAEIAQAPCVKRAYGRSFAYGLEGECDGRPIRITLASYEENQFGWARRDRISGDFSEAEAGRGLLRAFNSSVAGGLETGGFVTLNGYALPVSGEVGWSPFDLEPGEELLICSESLFRQLTGESGYTVLDVQFRHNVTDEDVADIRALAGENYRFSDRRLDNREARGGYYAFALFVYGFLAVIALIAAFHIINSVALSVSARMQQYGAMRAIGMGTGQLTRMVAAEALSYALGGVVLGSAAGVPIHRLLFTRMVSFQWGDPWAVPWKALLVIAAVTLAAVLLATLGPAQRIRKMSVAETISTD